LAAGLKRSPRSLAAIWGLVLKGGMGGEEGRRGRRGGEGRERRVRSPTRLFGYGTASLNQSLW